MSDATKALLERVRHAEDPTVADEERVLCALNATIVASAASGLGQGWEPTWRARLSAKHGGSLLKVSSLAALTATTIAMGIMLVVHNGQDATGESRAPFVLPSAAMRAPEAALPSAPARSAPERAVDVPAAKATSAARTFKEFVPTRRRSARSLKLELELLARVQAALRQGDGAAALRELDSHLSSDRMLRAERRAARVLALCMVGRVDEAQRAARAFMARYRDSPQREAIASSCANAKQNAEP